MFANSIFARPMLSCELLVHDHLGNFRRYIAGAEITPGKNHCAQCPEIVPADRHRYDRWAILGIDVVIVTQFVRATAWDATRGRQADGNSFHTRNRFQSSFETINERKECFAASISGVGQM